MILSKISIPLITAAQFALAAFGAGGVYIVTSVKVDQAIAASTTTKAEVDKIKEQRSEEHIRLKVIETEVKNLTKMLERIERKIERED